MRRPPWLRQTVTAAVVVAVLGTSACTESPAEPVGGTGEEIVEDALAAERAGDRGAPYDSAFFEELRSSAGEEVVVSAEVEEVLSPTAFIIARSAGTAVQPLLVVGAAEFADLAPGVPVRVTGTVQLSFDVGAVEEDLGVDLDDALFEDLAAEPFLVAEGVDVLEPAGG